MYKNRFFAKKPQYIVCFYKNKQKWSKKAKKYLIFL